MHRVLSIHLPCWPIDRLRRAGLLPSRRADAQSDEAPFAMVVAASGRRMLAAVNPAAMAKGIAAGMPLADALSFLPGLLTRPAQPAEDAAALRRLADWCTRYSPWAAPDGGDGVKIEVTGSAHLWGGEAKLAADLSARLARQRIVHRLAIADTLGAAWAVARFAAEEGRPAIVPPGGARAALAPLPAAALRLEPALIEGLHRVGLRRIGEIMAMPRNALARRFGPNGLKNPDGLENTVLRRLDQALGDLPEPLSPLGEVPSRRVRLSFAEPIADPADLVRAAERLTGDLVSRLAREGLGARRLGLGFHRVDGRVEHIAIGTARPSRDPVHLARLLTGKLDTVDPGLGIEDAILAAYAVERLASEQLQAPLPVQTNPHLPFPPAGEKAQSHRQRPTSSPASGGGSGWGPGLAPLFDRIGARLGLAALTRLEARESHIPEGASVNVPLAGSPHPNPPPLAGKGATNGGGSLPRQRGKAGVGVESSTKPPRPVRLFAPPEPLDAVLWVVPDDPPSRFTWRRRLHHVIQSDGPERIAEEWWQPDGRLIAAAGDPDAVRDYYRVEDETGRRFWLFRAGLAGDPPPRWFIHGLFA